MHSDVHGVYRDVKGRTHPLIISSHGGEDVPHEVKAWIELWLGQNSNSIALVALFDCPPEQNYQTQAIREYLSSVAKRGRMEFFAQPDDWPGRPREIDLLALDRTSRMNEHTLSLLTGAMSRDASFPRWGINE